MQQWDYLYVMIVEQFSKRVYRVMINGQVVKFPKGQEPTLADYLHTFRQDGWEPADGDKGPMYIFRRRRDNRADVLTAPLADDQSAG